MVAVLCVIAYLGGRWTSHTLTSRWLLHPDEHVPDRADAIAVLAGGQGERLTRALQLVDAGVADVLIISRGTHWDGPAARRVWDTCDHPPNGLTVLCFNADPDTTKGEAVGIARIAADHGVRSVALVTSMYHLERSMRWMHRCFDGTVYPVAATVTVERETLVHEWGGVIQQRLFDRSC